MKSVFIIAIVAVAMIGVMAPSAFAQSNDLILILDPFPMTANEGDSIMFSGILLTADGQYVISDAPILIKSDVPYGVDQSIAFATTDENGEFFTSWVATSDRINYNLYAIFEGDSVIPEVQSERFTFTVISNDNSSCDQKNFNSRINIDSVPSSAYVGETIEFVGTLSDVNGCPLINQKIHLVNPHIVRPYPDEIISSKDIVFATTTTNSQGMFAIEWNATHVVNDLIPELDLVFEGGNGSGSTKKSIDLEILRYNSSITLDPIPTSANIGDMITFSGTVALENENPDRYVVFIKDEDPLNQDDLLVSAEVNSNGQFSTTWTVMNLDADGIADIYASFEGTPTHHRSTTCDAENTGDFGASCLNTIPLKINTSDTPPEWIPPTDNSPKSYSFNGDEYAKMWISYDMPRTPVVVIIPHPDNYDEAVKSVTAVKEGILMWSLMIENEYGGDWDVDFVVLDKEYPQFPKEYDMKMHLVNYEQDKGCFDEYAGWAKWSLSGYDIRPINSHVCLTQLVFDLPTSAVSLISAHEFIHAMGMGHVWNKSNDLMCSTEQVNGEKVKTCPNSGFRQESIPSDFDLAIVTYMYGTDGWKNPNPNITPQNIFTADNFLNKENAITPVAPAPVAPAPVAPAPVAPAPVAPAPVAPLESDVTVNLNKLSYSTGDIIQVSGTISNPNMNEYIAIEILKPGVGLADVDDYLNLNAQGEFSTSFRTDGINWDKSGTYTIRVTGDSFNEFNKNITFTKTNSVTPSTEWKTTPQLTAVVTQTEVYSNKEHYIVNDKITLNGQTPSKITPVKIRIDDPNGNLVKLLQIPDNGNNAFSTSIKIEKLWFTQSGEYTINAWTSSAEPDKDSLKITIAIPGSEISQQMEQNTQLEAEQKAKIAQLEAEQKIQQDKIAQLEAEKQEAKIVQLEAQLEAQEKDEQERITQLEAEQNGGGCLIATATYGSEMSQQVQQLRELRDNQLLQTESGTVFMETFNDIYYSFSPIIADYERENPYFKEAVKLAITPMISTLSLMDNAESESEVLSIGISVIMLNIGMYLAVPAIVIVGIRKITQIN